MSMLDCFESMPAAREIITRSDQVPTDYERYGLWAQKFFGGGYHHEFKDGEVTVAGAPAPGPEMSTRH